MATAIPPILASLVLEALRRAGYSNPSADLQARATERWIEEIKSELWAKARNLKALQSKAVTVLSKGVAQYSNPSDYASDMTIVFATGARYGTAQDGTVSTVTLAATDAGVESDTVGREVVIVSGTGVGGISTISAFDEGTKIATITPSVTTAPDNTSGYVLLDDYRPLREMPIWDYDIVLTNRNLGYPTVFYPLGDASNGKLLLDPKPWREDSQPMVLLHRYQADLTEADTTGTLLLTLYQKWQPLWVSGLRWKALQNDDDDRAPSAFQEYQKSMRDIMNAEIYGHTISDLRVQVMDY